VRCQSNGTVVPCITDTQRMPNGVSRNVLLLRSPACRWQFWHAPGDAAGVAGIVAEEAAAPCHARRSGPNAEGAGAAVPVTRRGRSVWGKRSGMRACGTGEGASGRAMLRVGRRSARPNGDRRALRRWLIVSLGSNRREVRYGMFETASVARWHGCAQRSRGVARSIRIMVFPSSSVVGGGTTARAGR